MRTRLLFLSMMMLMSGCVTSTMRDGKPIETPPQEANGKFSMTKPSSSDSQANTNVRVSLVPKKDNPELYEYRVIEVYPKTVFSKLGFKSGDAILSIDGKAVQTMADVINVPSRLVARDFSKITIRRNGKNIVLQTKN